MIGFGIVEPAKQATASIFGTTAEAAQVNFAICSFVWMASISDDFHVHLCAADANYVIAYALTIEAAVSALIGIVAGSSCGLICGPVIAVAVMGALSIITLGWFWYHTDASGNVNFVIPNLTMLQPYGGNVLWADRGHWDDMPDQCWIVEDQWYRNPYC